MCGVGDDGASRTRTAAASGELVFAAGAENLATETQLFVGQQRRGRGHNSAGEPQGVLPHDPPQNELTQNQDSLRSLRKLSEKSPQACTPLPATPLPSPTQREAITRRFRVASTSQSPAAAKVLEQNNTTLLHNRDNILLSTSPASRGDRWSDKGSGAACPPPDLREARLAAWISSVSPQQPKGEKGGLVAQKLRSFQPPVKQPPPPPSAKKIALEKAEKQRALEALAFSSAIARANSRWLLEMEADQAQRSLHTSRQCEGGWPPAGGLWHDQAAPATWHDQPAPATSWGAGDAAVSGWARLRPLTSVHWPRPSREAEYLEGAEGAEGADKWGEGGEGGSTSCSHDVGDPSPRPALPRPSVAPCVGLMCLILLAALIVSASGTQLALVRTSQLSPWGGTRWARVRPRRRASVGADTQTAAYGYQAKTHERDDRRQGMAQRCRGNHAFAIYC